MKPGKWFFALLGGRRVAARRNGTNVVVLVPEGVRVLNGDEAYRELKSVPDDSCPPPADQFHFEACLNGYAGAWA